MADKREARIIIRRGHRADCLVDIDVYDPLTGKLTRFNDPAGPSQSSVDAAIIRLKNKLERAGNFVTFKEMR